MSSNLTPYDTGRRAEPKVWPTPTRDELAASEPIDRALLEARFGKVDFDNDESTTIASVWIDRDEHGRGIIHIQQFAEDLAVMVHG